MPNRRICCIWLIIALALPSIARAQDKPEEAAITESVKKYYAALAAEDLPALARLWSERSPDFYSSIQETVKAFEGADRAFSNLVISRVRVAGNKAIVKVDADFAVTDSQTKTTRQEKISRSLALLKERDEWKVWRDAAGDTDLSAFLEKGSEWKAAGDSVEQFVTAIVNAKSDDERNLLLDENKQMMTAGLRDALVRRGLQLEAQFNYRAAISMFRIAREISEKLGDKHGIAEAHHSLANSYRLAGDIASALQNYQTAITLFESLRRRADRAEALGEMGTVYFAQNKHREAVEAYEKSLKEYEALNDRAGQANALEEMASAHYNQEQYDRALEFFQRSLKLRAAGGTKAEVAGVTVSIGNVYFQQQDYDAAIINYRKALPTFEALGHREAVAGVTSNLGSAYFSNGDYEAALDHFQKAFRIEEELRNRRNMADALLNIAKVYSAVGNFVPALEALGKGLAYFEMTRDKSKTAEVLADIGQAYYQIRNYDAAIEKYQKSLALYLEMKSDADAGTVLAEIGNAQFSKTDYDAAVDSFQKAITHYEKVKHPAGVASLLASIASARYSQAKLDLAMEFFQRALAAFEALNDKAKVAATLERIASVHYSQTDYAKSLEVAARAYSIAEQVKDSDTLWRVRLTEAMDYRALSLIEKAAVSLEQSIAIIEAMRERVVRGERAGRFFQNKSGAYAAMLEMLVAQGKMIEAYDLAERMKTNLLWDVLQSGGVRVTKTMPAQENEQERRLESEVASLKGRIARERERKRPDEKRLKDFGARLEKALADYRAFEAKLYVARPRLKALRSEAAPLKIEQAARLIESDKTALVEFVVADSQIYLFVLTREKAERRATPTPRPQAPNYLLNVYAASAARADVAERVNRLHEMIAREGENIQPLARELYDLLLKPAEAQLSGKTSLVIVPDSFLWHLPFQALRTSDNRYLIEDRNISYAPSFTTLGEMTKQGARAGINHAGSAMLFAVGNPAVSEQTRERVKLAGAERPDPKPAAETEVKAVEQIYGAAQSKALTGAQASEEAVKQEAGKFRVVHLAAPATLNDASPTYSHIILSGSEENGKEDGLLEVWEVARQNLAGDIVVMSSSEAARVKAATGEAMMATAWALFIAGCPATVLSQWETDAADLMAELHRSIKAGVIKAPRGTRNLAASQALRQAALKLLRASVRNHPRHWAGFRVIGDWQ